MDRNLELYNKENWIFIRKNSLIDKIKEQTCSLTIDSETKVLNENRINVKKDTDA